MDNPRYTQPIIPILISILLAVILFAITEDFVRTVIVMPLLRVIWFISLVINSIPQGAIWAGAVMLLFVISILALTNNLPGQNSRNPEKHQTKGQVEKWVQLLENGQSNPFSRWLLAKELKRFTRKLLTNAEDLHLSQIEFNNMELPDEIRAFFDASQPSSNREQFGQSSENALDLDPEVVIQYLEEKVNA